MPLFNIPREKLNRKSLTMTNAFMFNSSILVTFTRPKGMNDFQFKDLLSDTESQYGVFSAIRKLVG
jgi:hypothetical protein